MSVINDLYTDPRVDKTCLTLVNMGFEVILIGCRHKHSPSLSPRVYQIRRLRLLFKKGPLFFAEFNTKLFFYLLFKKCDILTANDLDTLLPNFLISRFRRKELVYDSHEYYCNQISVIHRPFVRKVWQSIEKYCFPKLKHVITVCDSIAREYQKEYGVEVKVVRNIPPKANPPITESRSSLALPEDQMIVIMQGNNISEDRGAEELVEAMPYVKEALLLIVGDGTALPALKNRVKELNMEKRVIFTGRVQADLLHNYTYLADIGVSFEKGTSLSYYYSLPNKIFEYMKAGTPFISSNLPERVAIVEKYQTGIIIKDLSPQTIANAINEMTENKALYGQFKANCPLAAQELNWENEEEVIRGVYHKCVSLPQF